MARDNPALLPAVVRRSYAARFALALSLAIVVMVAFGGVISAQTASTLQNDVRGDLTTLSNTQADRLDEWLGTVQRDVRATSTHPVVEDGSTAAVQDYLDRLSGDDRLPPDVRAVHYYDVGEGEILASSSQQFVGVSPAEQGAPFAADPPGFDGPGDTYVSPPFRIAAYENPIVAVISPVDGPGDRAIIYMTDLETRTQSLSQERNGSYLTVVNDQGTFVAHPNASKILTSHEGGADVAGLSPGESRFMEMGDTLMAMTKLQRHGWTVMIHSDRQQAYALSQQINSSLVGLILLAVINLALVRVTVGSNTIVSLSRLRDRAEEMAEGDLAVNLDTAREDEIGQLYAAFDDMRTSLRAKIAEAEEAREEAEAARKEAERAREEAVEESEAMAQINEHLEEKATEYREVLGAAADGDLTRRAETASRNEAMASVGSEINSTLEALEETIAEMKSFATSVLEGSQGVADRADRVDEASHQVSRSIGEIFDGTTEQSDRLQDAAGDMENLSATAEEVAASAQEVAETSEAAAAVGEQGQAAAQEAITEMHAIEDRTQATVTEINALDDDLDEIGEIVSVISDVVEQTNLLALNASIEAAHADTSGDGFAVVADEIKSLAEETKEAAADIEDRIERIQSQAGDTVETMEATSERITDGVETVEEAVESLETIVEYTETVDVGIQEIDEATEEQAHTAQEVMGMIDELTSISQQTAAEADTVATAAEDQTDLIAEVNESTREFQERADELADLLERFEVDPAREEIAATAGGDD